MKIRTGFVSNSSSSSFCIYGVYIDDNITKVGKEKLCKEAEKIDLFFSYGPDRWDGCYIGKSWATIKDAQTGKQFKTEVEELITTLFGKEMECSTHEEGWFDG